MQCGYCEWRCDLDGGALRRMPDVLCGPGRNQGALSQPLEHAASPDGVDVPFYHAIPAAGRLVIGTMPAAISAAATARTPTSRKQRPGREARADVRTDARRAGAQARKLACHSIVFNVNEPTVSLPSLLA